MRTSPRARRITRGFTLAAPKIWPAPLLAGTVAAWPCTVAGETMGEAEDATFAGGKLVAGVLAPAAGGGVAVASVAPEGMADGVTGLVAAMPAAGGAALAAGEGTAVCAGATGTGFGGGAGFG